MGQMKPVKHIWVIPRPVPAPAIEAPKAPVKAPEKVPAEVGAS